MSRYSGSVVAPYWRFRVVGSEMVADVMGCNWTCDGCWSKYGWHTVRPRYELDPAGVVERAVQYAHKEVRITGGEPGLYWSHMVGVVGLLARQGVSVVVETAGTLFSPRELLGVDRALGSAAANVTIEIGLKATDPRELGRLTGLPYDVAVRSHRRQLANLFAGRRCEALVVRGTVLDRYSTAGAVSALRQIGADVHVLTFERLGDATRFYTPKRKRR